MYPGCNPLDLYVFSKELNTLVKIQAHFIKSEVCRFFYGLNMKINAAKGADANRVGSWILH